MADETTPVPVVLQVAEDTPQNRKWRAFFWCMGLVTAGYIATVKWEAATAEYATFGGMVIALYLAYIGGNIGNKWVVRRGQGVSVGIDPNEVAGDTVMVGGSEVKLPRT